jgi:hypothetical protein
MSQLAVMPRSDFDVIKEQAQILLESGFLPKAIDTVPKAVAIAMHGAELGIPIWTALNNINVIQGKPSASPQLMLALINRSGQLEDMSIDVNDERAIVTMKRKGRTAHIEEFSMADARQMMTTEYVNGQRKQIPLADKYNWKQMPQTMMKWRAVAACARVAFPDCILGLYTPEEMGADVSVDDEGNMTVIEVKREAPPQPQLVDKNVDTTTGEVVTQQPAPQPVETVDNRLGRDDDAPRKDMEREIYKRIDAEDAGEVIPDLPDADVLMPGSPSDAAKATEAVTTPDPLNWVEEFREETGATIEPLFFETKAVAVNKKDNRKTLTFSSPDGKIVASAFTRDPIKPLVSDETYKKLEKIGFHELDKPVKVWFKLTEKGYREVERIEAA